jgi:hypothetical protein
MPPDEIPIDFVPVDLRMHTTMPDRCRWEGATRWTSLYLRSTTETVVIHSGSTPIFVGTV